MTKTLKDIFQYVLAGLIITGFFVLLYALVHKEVPEPNKDLLNLIVGALIGSFATIVGYFFGSSKGSAEKTDVMNKQIEEIKSDCDDNKP
jgi:uncharacterized membrane protein